MLREENKRVCGFFVAGLWATLVVLTFLAIVQNSYAWHPATCSVNGLRTSTYSCCCQYGALLLCTRYGCPCSVQYWTVKVKETNTSAQISLEKYDSPGSHPIGTTAKCWLSGNTPTETASWNNPAEILPWTETILGLLFFCACSTLMCYCKLTVAQHGIQNSENKRLLSLRVTTTTSI